MTHYIVRIGLVLQLVLLASIPQSIGSIKGEFPGRAKYQDVPVISKANLMAKYGDVIIVDTRSGLEFETLQIKGARNIPVASKLFVNKMDALRASTDKTIVFYCNGRSCMKSYMAVKLFKKNKIKNTVAYDAGIFEWARTYPKHSVLLGQSPIRQSDLISKKKFHAHSLSPNQFSEEMYKRGSKSLVVDIRDKYQRGAAGFFPSQELWASLDDRAKLNAYIKQAKKEDRVLFIYDEVGKQVRWLQYALEKENIKNYFFMAKGAKGYYAQMMSEFNIK